MIQGNPVFQDAKGGSIHAHVLLGTAMTGCSLNQKDYLQGRTTKVEGHEVEGHTKIPMGSNRVGCWYLYGSGYVVG